MQTGRSHRIRRVDRRGSVAVETALALGFVLLPLLLGAWDLAEVVAIRARADAALHAAMLAAWSGSDPAEAAGAAYGPSGPPLAVATPETGCVCMTPAGTRQSGSAAPCTASCPAGESQATYVTLSLNIALALPLPLPGLASPFPIADTATVRIR